MRQTLVMSIAGAVLMLGTFASNAAAQATSIPLSLSVTATPSEINAGGTASVEVRLRNYRGDTVPAQEDATVTIHSELSGDASVRFKPGQSVAQTEVAFPRGGIATLVASAPSMTSGTTAVVVKAAVVKAEAAASVSPRVPAPAGSSSGAASAVPAPRASAPAEAQRVMLAVDVLPDHVHPSNASWQAKVLVTSVNENRQPVAVSTDTPIQLAIDVGTLSPAQATIAAGHARATEQIQLTSTRAGAGTLWAWTDNGDLGRAAVEFHNPMATQLAVKGLPTHTLNDGRTAINITVFLQDETAVAVKADEDVQVKLVASIGTPKPSLVSIPKGQFVGEAVLTSATAGVAEITATAPALKSGVASVTFEFPYLLVVLAGVGGMIGALVRSSGVTFTGAWWWHLLGSLAIGSVLGLVFYLLAVFGIVASIPKLTIPLGQLPTSNDFAALVLGFFGGYYARAWLPNPGNVPGAPAPSHV